MQDLELLRKSLDRAKDYQDEITDTHFIIGNYWFSEDFSSKGKELSVALVDKDPLLASGKPYEETMVFEVENPSESFDGDTFDEESCEKEPIYSTERATMETGPQWGGLTDVGCHYFNDDRISYRISYGDEGLTPGYIVRLHEWIYRVADIVGIQSLQLTFLTGFRRTLVSVEEFIAASEGKQMPKPQQWDDSYFNIPNIKASNNWLRTIRCSFNDDLESLLESIQSGHREQKSMSLYRYKQLNELEMERLEHELRHPMLMFRRINHCPYFYDTLPQIQARKPHITIGGYKKIVAQDNLDYIYARSECHRKTFSGLSQEFTDLKK